MVDLESCFVRDAVVVGHLGGESQLYEAGTLEIGRTAGAPPVMLTSVYLVEPEMLPAGIVALLGVADIRTLGISLDTVLAHLDRHWEHAVLLSVFGRLRRFFGRCTRRFRPPPEDRVPAPERRPPERVLVPEPRPARIAGSPPGTAFVPHTLPARRSRNPEEECALLDDTKQQAVDDQGRRTANRVAELFLAGQARTRALREARATALRGPGRWTDQGFSSSSAPSWP
jgi:hypothetical protein